MALSLGLAATCRPVPSKLLPMRFFSFHRIHPSSFANHSETPTSSQPEEDGETESQYCLQPKNILAQIQAGGDVSDWNDRMALQNKWSNQDKGWQVDVTWKDTPFGVGLFAEQDIREGTILRVGTPGYNLVQFRNVEEIEDFCHGKAASSEGVKGKHAQQNTDEEYLARLHYVKDYLWGFSPHQTDAQGYDLASSPPVESGRFFGMWLPGNGLNHNLAPNTVYRTRKGGIQKGLVLKALRDIRKGDELYDDYRRHGRAPQWLLEFAKLKQVTLNFAECNDFVKNV